MVDEIVERTAKPKWTALANRRAINYGGIVGRHSLIACDDTPDWLKGEMRRVDRLRILPQKLNHCLLNEYHPGQGIMVGVQR